MEGVDYDGYWGKKPEENKTGFQSGQDRLKRMTKKRKHPGEVSENIVKDTT